MTTPEDLPEWARTSLTILLGAGGAKMLGVWLENRRLMRQEYRETLRAMIEDLQRQVSALQTRVGNLRVEVAHLEEALADERERSDELDQANVRLRARLVEVDPDHDPDREG